MHTKAKGRMGIVVHTRRKGDDVEEYQTNIPMKHSRVKNRARKSGPVKCWWVEVRFHNSKSTFNRTNPSRGSHLYLTTRPSPVNPMKNETPETKSQNPNPRWQTSHHNHPLPLCASAPLRFKKFPYL